MMLWFSLFQLPVSSKFLTSGKTFLANDAHQLGSAGKGSHHIFMGLWIASGRTTLLLPKLGIKLNSRAVFNTSSGMQHNTKSTRFSYLTKQLLPKSALAARRGHLKSQKVQGNSGKIECCTSSSKQQRGQMREGRPYAHLSLIRHNKTIEKYLQRLYRNAFSLEYLREKLTKTFLTVFLNGKHLDF